MNPESNVAPAALPAEIRALRQIAQILIPVGFATAMTDFLFWDSSPGASVGLLFAGLGLLLFLLHREHSRLRTWCTVVLLGATCAQSIIELSLSNVLAALVLTLVLAGDAFQSHLGGLWARISEAFYGFVTSPARWGRIGALAAPMVNGMRNEAPNLEGYTRFGFKVIVPAGVLLVIFSLIFAAGNAAFRDLLQHAHNSAFDLWSALDITPLRLFWWGLIATGALGLLHGTPAPDDPRWWTQMIPRVPRSDVRLARWQTAAALLAMNALFFAVNTLDVVYLWSGALPLGVSHSDFVHSGVNSLIVAVVLSALVIAGMFQQAAEAVNTPWLKRLAHLWVLQNFVLIVGVLKRLMLYTESYQLTEKRIYVGCFLALVTVGFLLLAWFVQKRRSFNWLLGANAAATFGFFFVLQFMDVAGWVAHYNVRRWEQGAPLDLAYLANLGPSALPAMIRVAETSKDAQQRSVAQAHLGEIRTAPKTNDWRSYQWREAESRRQVAAYFAAQ